jgi:hypothetical protein
MSKHTPGPWIWGNNYKGLYGADPHNAVLDYAGYEGMWLAGVESDRAQANARLIAAAPELLEVLRTLVEHRSRCFIPEEADFPHLANWTERARAAIDKAGGNDE